MDTSSDSEAKPRPTILFIHLHGYIRAEDLELGRNADTGGQTKYVLESARALGELSSGANVHIITRFLKGRNIDSEYSLCKEKVSEKVDILRVKFGGTKYYRKEKLWPFLDECVKNTQKLLQEQNIHPDIIYSHYADAGYVGMKLSQELAIPQIHSSHSLGISKKLRLLEHGWTEEKINERFCMEQRISVEHEIIKNASLLIASSQHEKDIQLSRYSTFSPKKAVIIPPGIERGKFFPYYYSDRSELLSSTLREKSLQTESALRHELGRFLTDPEKPLILAICRPEKRKNLEGLIAAYGEDKELQSIANLAIFAGIRGDISQKNRLERETLTDMLLNMDKYNLYGRLAIPKEHHFDSEVPELYRLAARLGGVFVNSALTEPFGLTIIEAASCGLPVVAPKNGGAKNIINEIENGIAVNTESPKEIAGACREILLNRQEWEKYSQNGINGAMEKYSWSAYAKRFLRAIEN